jgi:hypothetical protein
MYGKLEGAILPWEICIFKKRWPEHNAPASSPFTQYWGGVRLDHQILEKIFF